MNRKSKAMLCGLLPCLAILASCGNSSSSLSLSRPSNNSSSPTVSNYSYYVNFKGSEIASGSTQTVSVNDKTAMLCAYYLKDSSEADVTYASSDANVIAVDANSGLLTIKKAGSATITVTNDQDSSDPAKTFTFTATDPTVASGPQSFATASYDEKANILGQLEKYAVDNYLTGLTLFSNGGYVVYNDRYIPTPSSYVSGYGWGTMKEGKITKASTASDVTPGHEWYYHSGTLTLFSHANAMDASGSDVSQLAEYTTASYYSTRLNATNDGYEWYPSLATCQAPIPVDENGNVIDSTNTLQRRWRIYVRTGDKAPVYRTASTMPEVQKFNKQKVVLEDYLTPFRFMLTNANGQYRGSELTDGVSGITDAASYFNSTSSIADGELYDAQKWNDIMGDSSTSDKKNASGERGSLITGSDAQGDYIEFKLLSPCTQFYAMYYLSSSLYSPLPMDFIKVWGANGLGKSPNGKSPVDTMLYVGPYYIEYWDANRQSLKRNDDFYEYKEGYTLNDGTTHRQPYQIVGFDFIPCNTSSELESRFASGILDSYAPDQNTLPNYNMASGTTSAGVHWNRYQTQGDSNFKLNINSMTQEQWDERFGPNGTVQAHPASNTYEVKPYMSNKNFLDFLSFALDRQSICEARGTTPTQDYFSDNYLIDPESGVSYNSTDAHKAVLADRYNSTYGYNVDAAKEALRQAITGENGLRSLGLAGKLKSKTTGGSAGTSANPWLITIDMYWMNTTDTTDYSDVFDSIERIFKEVVDEEYYGAYELNIVEHPGSGDYNEVYNKMKEGTFDLGFGAISGNDLNPINFMEVLKSDNSSGFTLNWGASTEAHSDDIVYDGKTWSYDALWQAADSVAAVNSKGEVAEVQNVSTGPQIEGSSQKYQTISGTTNSNGTVTYRLSLNDLLEGGADKSSIRIGINNGSTSEELTLDQLNLDDNNQFTLTLDADYNTATTADETTGVVSTTETPTVTVTATYNISVNGMSYESSSRMTLSTWYGIKNAG